MCVGLSADERGVNGGVRRDSCRKGVRRRQFPDGDASGQEALNHGVLSIAMPQNVCFHPMGTPIGFMESFGSDCVLGS